MVTVTDDETAGITVSTPTLTIEEGDSDTYTVKLATEPTGAVKVSIGGASETDLTVSPSSLTFTRDNWNTAQMVTVKAAEDDDAVDDTATLTHTASGGNYNPVGRNLKVTVEDDDSPAMPAAWLARFGGTFARQAFDGIAWRMAMPQRPGFEGTLAGQTVGGPPERIESAASIIPSAVFADPDGRDGGLMIGGTGMTAGEALSSSRFILTAEMDGNGNVTFWGQGARSGFGGSERASGFDGAVTTAMFGIDYAWDRWITGVAVARSEGEGGFREPGIGSGNVETALDAALPYVSLQPSERLKIWAATGFGEGTMMLSLEDGPVIEADIDWKMAAAGLRAELLTPEKDDGFALTSVSDALWSQTGSARLAAAGLHPGLEETESQTSRARAGLTASWTAPLEGGGSITPRMEIWTRRDSGDTGTGSAVEFGMGVAWTVPELGLSFDLAGRSYRVRGTDKRRDSGLAASVSYDSDPASGRGLWLGLRHESGGWASSGGYDDLFAPAAIAGPPVSDPEDRWIAGAAYGFPALGNRFTAGPVLEYSHSGESREYSVGWSMHPASENAPDISFSLETTFKRKGKEEWERGIGLDITAHW